MKNIPIDAKQISANIFESITQTVPSGRTLFLLFWVVEKFLISELFKSAEMLGAQEPFREAYNFIR